MRAASTRCWVLACRSATTRESGCDRPPITEPAPVERGRMGSGAAWARGASESSQP